MNYIIPMLAALILFTTACSRSGGISLEAGERLQKDSVPTVIVPVVNMTASDSTLMGDWSLLKEYFDHPDPYPPGTVITGTLSLKENAVFVKIRNGVMLDSGRFRVVDTGFYGGAPRPVVVFNSTFRKPSYTEVFYLRFKHDTLNLHSGFVGFDYKKTGR